MPATVSDEKRFEILEQFVDSMNCGLVARDLGLTITYANTAFLKWTGYTLEELVGQPMSSLVPPEIADVFEAEAGAVDEGDRRCRLLAVQRKDGTTFPVVTIPNVLRNARGEPEGHYGIVVDLGAVQTAKRIASSPNELRNSLSRIALELQSISLSVATEGDVSVPLHHPKLKDLSPRESEVLVRLVSGERVPGIANRLHISPHTVRNHLKSIFRKLDVSSQVELISHVRALARHQDD